MLRQAEQSAWQLCRKKGGKLNHLKFHWKIVTSNLLTNASGRPSNDKNVDIRYDCIDKFAELQEKQTRCSICHAICFTRCRECDVGILVFM
jgi:hypothetical protein